MSALTASHPATASPPLRPLIHPAPQRRFDDFLHLRSASFSRHRLIVFDGRSGSGKSTAIEFLLSEHRDFRGRRVRLIDITNPELDHQLDIAVVDDLREPRHLLALVRLLSRSRTLIVASHLGPGWFRPLQAMVKTTVYQTDVDHAKIRRRLDAAGLFATDPVIAAYVGTFGATYTDIDIILERYPDTSFDRSFARFRRYCSVRCEDRPEPGSDNVAP